MMRVLPGPLTRLSASPVCLFFLTSSPLPFPLFSPLRSPSSLLPISFSFSNSPSSLSSLSRSPPYFHRPRLLSRPLSQTFSSLVPTFLDFSSCPLFYFLPLWPSPPSLCSVFWSPFLPPIACPWVSLGRVAPLPADSLLLFHARNTFAGTSLSPLLLQHSQR